MSLEQGEQVEVLYNYSYKDDNGKVEIKAGEVYRLLEKTNSEWWHVCDRNKKEPIEEEDGIFVPAQYVRVLKEKQDNEVDSAISSLDNVLEDEENEENALVRQPVVNSAPAQEPSNRFSTFLAGRPPSDHSVNGMGKTPYDDEADYVNLDQYRVDANITSLDKLKRSSTNSSVGESDYANLPCQQADQHHNEQGLQLEDGTYVRTLLDGLPWDIYEDRATKRKFFHNRETGELTWKPPRKDKPSSPVESNCPRPEIPPVAPKKCQDPQSPAPVFALQPPPEHSAGSDNVYEKKVHEGGDVVFVHKTTKEEWQQLVDESGRQYFHRLGSNDTQWELPFTRSKSESRDSSPRPRNGERLGDIGASATGTSTLTRQSKAKSMYGKLEMSMPEHGSLKAGTLPPNFSPAPGMEKSPSLPSFQFQPPPPSSQCSAPFRFEDQLAGYLNKTKITDTGRKVRKNWSQAFVVIQATNMVFYKDHKAAEKKAGSPHGKPDSVISLHGARVDFNPTKDVTGSSRKNTILLSVSSGNQFLLHTDDEKKIHEWLVRLKLVANDLRQDQAAASRGQEGNTGKPVAVSVVGRSLSTTSDDMSASDRSNWTGIRTKLLNFIARRPAQEDLVKRGIFKDAVFGSSLQSVCDRDKSPVPNFILECITAVEHKGLEHDGLYRISGNMAEIQRLRYIVDKDEDHNLLDDQWDIHTLTGALKLFFRELREPLFSFKCVEKFVEASKKESKKDKMKAFKEALSSLPKCHYETMRVLFQHLTNLIQFSHENRMQTQNVAIVFGPTLMSAEGDFANMAVRTMYHSKVVEFLLLEYENLFR